MADEKSHEIELSESARRSLSRFLDSSGRDLGEQARDHILELAILVAHWGSRMNLSGYRDPESVMSGLICDALGLWFAVEDHEEVQLGERVADLGSGAGFPGLPLALINPGIRVTLVESRQRRHHFQRAVRRHLALENVEPKLGRIEDMEPVISDLVVAQAVAQPEQALELGLPWVHEGGVVLIPGNRPDPEMAAHKQIGQSGVFRYSTPAREEGRWLWWGRKVDDPG